MLLNYYYCSSRGLEGGKVGFILNNPESGKYWLICAIMMNFESNFSSFLWFACVFAGVSAIHWSCLQSGLAEIEFLGAGARWFWWCCHFSSHQRGGWEMATGGCPDIVPAPGDPWWLQGWKSQVCHELQLRERLWVCCYLWCWFPTTRRLPEANCAPFQGIAENSTFLCYILIYLRMSPWKFYHLTSCVCWFPGQRGCWTSSGKVVICKQGWELVNQAAKHKPVLPLWGGTAG